MSTIVTRAGKGAPLTHSEVDANFNNLNTDKYQAGDSPSFGNISVTGTVDGRDVSADGAKLDGIESGATADQTAAEILTAIKTVDGSGSGLDADLLDGLNSSQFLRADASDTTTGTLSAATFNATSTTNGGFQGIDADSATNPSFTWSADLDTGMYRSGTNQIGFTTGGTVACTISGSNFNVVGALYAPTVDTNSVVIGAGVTLSEATDRADLLLIKSSTSSWAGLQIQNTSNEGLWSLMTDGTTGGIYDDMSNAWHIQFIDGGETRLYHAGSEKLNTTSGGVTVTGTCSATAFSGSGASLTNLPAPTTAQVGSATAGLSTGAVGSYALLYFYGTGVTEGSTKAGSSLFGAGITRGASLSADADTAAYLTRGGTAQSGTWRCMGRAYNGSTSNYSRVTLWMRIS